MLERYLLVLITPGAERIRSWASQAPSHARGRVIKTDHTVHAALRHRLHYDGAEPASLRRRHRRPIALDPVHGKGVAGDAPRDIDAAFIGGKRPVFSSVGGEFVEREPDGLRGSRREAQLGPIDADARTNEIGEVRELGTNQVLGSRPQSTRCGRAGLDWLTAPEPARRSARRNLPGFRWRSGERSSRRR